MAQFFLQLPAEPYMLDRASCPRWVLKAQPMLKTSSSNPKAQQSCLVTEHYLPVKAKCETSALQAMCDLWCSLGKLESTQSMGMKFHPNGSGSAANFLRYSLYFFFNPGVIHFGITFPVPHSHPGGLAGKVPSVQQNNVVLMGLLTG